MEAPKPVPHQAVARPPHEAGSVQHGPAWKVMVPLWKVRVPLAPLRKVQVFLPPPKHIGPWTVLEKGQEPLLGAAARGRRGEKNRDPPDGLIHRSPRSVPFPEPQQFHYPP